MLEDAGLIAQLEGCRSLPTPPGVAEQIISLSAQESSDVSKLAQVVSHDPALTVKILRMANSPLYARAQKIDCLEQAIMMFGWNGTLNLALSFSLVSKIENTSNNGLDYVFFWKRSLAAAVACKHLASVSGITSRQEDLFLPGLLQDIGMLALDKVMPTLYEKAGESQHDHKYLQDLEIKSLGVDHADVGGWLLKKWNLPERIIDLVCISHGEKKYELENICERAKNCMEVSNIIADCICNDVGENDYHHAAEVAEELLNLDKSAFIENLEQITNEIKDTSTVFELDIGDPNLLNCIVEQAKEMLLLRSMETLKTAEELHQAAEVLESKAQKLEDTAKKDPLTNIYNRGYLELSLAREFDLSLQNKKPLSVVMVDLDHFKSVNDTYGHDCGDKVLKYAVSILGTCIRASDTLYRYGGEEFVILLPKTGTKGVESLASRIIEAYNNNSFEYQNGTSIPVKASLGVVIHGENIEFKNWEELLNTADYCLYKSKSKGRNQYTLYDEADSIRAAAS